MILGMSYVLTELTSIFCYLFFSQLTKEQLLSVLPLLVQHLQADNYVTYSFAAITIERVLFIKENGIML